MVLFMILLFFTLFSESFWTKFFLATSTGETCWCSIRASFLLRQVLAIDWKFLPPLTILNFWCFKLLIQLTHWFHQCVDQLTLLCRFLHCNFSAGDFKGFNKFFWEVRSFMKSLGIMSSTYQGHFRHFIPSIMSGMKERTTKQRMPIRMSSSKFYPIKTLKQKPPSWLIPLCIHWKFTIEKEASNLEPCWCVFLPTVECLE